LQYHFDPASYEALIAEEVPSLSLGGTKDGQRNDSNL
jgi:hypothetical protein